MYPCRLAPVLAMVFAAPVLAEAGDEKLAEQLKPFAPLLGKTWKGDFKNSTPDMPLFDTVRWERALNGQAIRIVHSVNDGIYGGETTIIWDAKRKTLAYWYFTTAGFRTEGTMKYANGEWTAHETVVGNAGGITEVRSTSKILPDGRLRVKAEYLKDGKWGEAREVNYKVAPTAKVIFK